MIFARTDLNPAGGLLILLPNNSSTSTSIVLHRVDVPLRWPQKWDWQDVGCICCAEDCIPMLGPGNERESSKDQNTFYLGINCKLTTTNNKRSSLK